MPMITNAQAARTTCWSKDKRWGDAYGKLCHAKILADELPQPSIAELIEQALDRLVDES